MLEKVGQWVGGVAGGVWGVVLVLTALWLLFGPVQKVAMDFGVYLAANWQALLTAAVVVMAAKVVKEMGG
jgi:hypothetical protein